MDYGAPNDHFAGLLSMGLRMPQNQATADRSSN